MREHACGSLATETSVRVCVQFLIPSFLLPGESESKRGRRWQNPETGGSGLKIRTYFWTVSFSVTGQLLCVPQWIAVHSSLHCSSFISFGTLYIYYYNVFSKCLNVGFVPNHFRNAQLLGFLSQYNFNDSAVRRRKIRSRKWLIIVCLASMSCHVLSFALCFNPHYDKISVSFSVFAPWSI